MSCYSIYIFDRHTKCIYSRRWTPSPSTRPSTSTSTATTSQPGGGGGPPPALSATRLAQKDLNESQLIFGTVFSLRRMVRQLGGESDQFLSYRTGEYKLHYFETPTQLKFVMLTDPRVAGNMRTVLHQIWATLYVEYVIKNPLSDVEHPGGSGVASELFEGGLESFIATIFPSQ